MADKLRKIRELANTLHASENKVLFSSFLIIAALHGYLYTFGYRLNVDDIYYHRIYLEGFQKSFEYTNILATTTGRIGQFISAPLVMIGSYLSDWYGFRLIYVFIHFLNFYLFSRLVSKIISTDISLPFLFLAFSLQPLNDKFLPPTAYPLLLSIPFLTLLLLRIRIEIKTSNQDLEINFQNIATYLFYALVLMINEYAMIFGFFLLLIEYFLKTETIMKKRKLFFDSTSLLVALGIYFFYRMNYPSEYSGNIPDGFGNFSAILKTAIGHAYSGLSISTLRHSEPFLPFQSKTTEQLFGMGIPALLVFVCGSIFTYQFLAMKNQINKFGSIAIFSFFCIFLISGPTALTLKYQQLCEASCIGMDGRISIYASCLCILGLLFYTTNILKKIINTYLIYGSISAIIGATSAYTYAYNYQSAEEMKIYVSGWARAKNLACTGGIPESDEELFRIIDPDKKINPNPDSAMGEYWRLYMKDRSDHC